MTHQDERGKGKPWIHSCQPCEVCDQDVDDLRSERDSYIAKFKDTEEHLRLSRAISEELRSKIATLEEKCKDYAGYLHGRDLKIAKLTEEISQLRGRGFVLSEGGKTEKEVDELKTENSALKHMVGDSGQKLYELCETQRSKIAKLEEMNYALSQGKVLEQQKTIAKLEAKNKKLLDTLILTFQYMCGSGTEQAEEDCMRMIERAIEENQ